jgi:hypothetical protein
MEDPLVFDLHDHPAGSGFAIGFLATLAQEFVMRPGTRMHGKSRMPARAIIIAGNPLSQVAMPMTPVRVGSDRISRRNTIAASLRYGKPRIRWVSYASHDARS